MNILLVIIIIAVALILAGVIWLHTKRLKISNVYFIDGGVKVGKSFVAVALAVKTYKKNLRKYYITLPLLKLKLKFQKKEFNEKEYKPMLYSNIPLRYVRYNKFTSDILLRKVRMPRKSVVLLDEMSLLADSMLYKDQMINDTLTLFFKLFGHSTWGGTCIIDSQTISDNHYAVKRSIGRYLYIYQKTKFPFFSNIKCIERIYSDDGQTQNVTEGDIESYNKSLLFLNKYHKFYDCYCYSVFTDDLYIQVNYNSKILTRKDSLKCNNLVTLHSFGDLVNISKQKENMPHA